jgi:outer membrane lipoprotein-sorting protein
MPYIPTMPIYRFLPALGIAALIPLASWAQGPAAPAPAGSVENLQAQAKAKADAAANEVPTAAELTIDEATKKLAALKSVSCDITQKVDMLDQKFEIGGRYLRAPNNHVLLRLKVTGLPDAEGVMLQVCDGTTLWDYQQILDAQSYQKTTITKVLEKLSAPELDEAIRAEVKARLGFAGPDELLKGLRKYVKFDQKESTTLDGKPVWMLVGAWKNPAAMIQNPQQQAQAPPRLPMIGQLPAYIPSLVRVYIGKEDGWPYKITLIGRDPTVLLDGRKRGVDGQLIGAKSSVKQPAKTRMEVTYANVKINPTLAPDEFAFQPPKNARFEDHTDQYVAGLDQAIQMRQAQKKIEASKAEDPLLKESIPVPSATAPKTP